MNEVISFSEPTTFNGKKFDGKTTVLICTVVLIVSGLLGFGAYKLLRGTN